MTLLFVILQLFSALLFYSSTACSHLDHTSALTCQVFFRISFSR